MITYIAHRGLWDKRIPENSLKAIENAVENNLPMEIDIQLTKDNKLVIFHDENLKRLTGVNKMINELTLEEIKKLRLNNTKEVIPTLEEVLDLVDGKVLIDIEIKDYNNSLKIVKEAIKILRKYRGLYIIKSFNPIIPWYYKKKMPNIKCGVLAGIEPKKYPEFLRRFFRYFKYTSFYKPDFICYNVLTIDDKVIDKLKKEKIDLYLYTIKDKDTLKKGIELSNYLVFEGIRPYKK